jgi:hypothetical protein
LKNFVSRRLVQICAAVLLLAALFDWPYGFYTFLRLAVCLAAAVLAWQSYKAKRPAWALAMTGFTLLFNPFIQVHFHRNQWSLIDAVAAVVFLACPPSRAGDQEPTD